MVERKRILENRILENRAEWWKENEYKLNLGGKMR